MEAWSAGAILAYMTNTRLLIILTAISSLTVFASSILAPIEARYVLNIVGNPATAGVVFAVGSIFFAILSYFLGTVSDRAGRRPFILIGLSVAILYPLWYASIQGAFAAFGVKLAWAFSAVAAGPILSAYIQDVIDTASNKGALFGYLYSAQSIAGSFGALLGGWLAQAFDLSAPFYALAAISALTFVIAYAFLPADRPHAEKHAGTKSLVQVFAFIISKPPLQFYLSLNTSFGINWGIKSFLWPLVVYDIAKSDLATGSIFATMGIVAFFLLPFAGKIVDRFGAYRISLVQFAILGTTGVAMALTHTLSLFWILAAVYTIGEVLNLGQSVIMTEHVPSAIRGQVAGLDAVMDRALNTVAPLFAGFLLTALPAATVLLLFMLLYWVSLIVAWRIYHTTLRVAVSPRV
ncbi:MFS transporter [Candidatus Kaiserbacteria bacterium]|nr:MFS transporter [Candidatus Kaiserbacteria bacterium]